MSSKIRYIVIAIVATVLILPSASAQVSDVKVGRNIEVLINLYRDLNVFYVDEVDADKMLENAAYGMTMQLDPYTEFMAESDMEQFEVMTTGKYGGIGAMIRQKGDWVHIAQPYEGSPADRAGLQIGDKIVAIDGQSAEAITTQKVSSLLRGDPGTTVMVTVEKFYTGEQQKLEIKRERISISSIPYFGFVNDSIGYICHSDFTQNSSDDMRNAVMTLKNSGKLKGLILDYRGNGGGILQEAVKILSLFVPKGTEVVSMRGRLEQSVRVFTTETDPVDTTTPIVVLTNRGSASAAEIVAGALQDLDRGVLVGQRTFGKALVQSSLSLGYNSMLKITTAKYYIPSGRCIQAIDYIHRDEDGSVAYVPDSLIKEFTTINGRKVYDGGGIMPDVKMTPSYVSRFTIITYSKGYIDDFADLYTKKHRESVDVRNFKLSDSDYAWFVDFMEDKDVEYQSETAQALKNLREKAEREMYIDDISGELEHISTLLKDDKVSNLQLYRAQLSDLIESDIVMRWHYERGVKEHNIVSDYEVRAATELLGDQVRYGKIISSQDTSKEQ